MKLIPLNKRIVVKLDKGDEKSAGGILIPETAQQDRNVGRKGVVVAVGPGRWCEEAAASSPGGPQNPLWGRYREPMEVREGDQVVLSLYGGVEVEEDGDKFLIVTTDHLEAIRR